MDNREREREGLGRLAALKEAQKFDEVFPDVPDAVVSLRGGGDELDYSGLLLSGG